MKAGWVPCQRVLVAEATVLSCLLIQVIGEQGRNVQFVGQNDLPLCPPCKRTPIEKQH